MSVLRYQLNERAQSRNTDQSPKRQQRVAPGATYVASRKRHWWASHQWHQAIRHITKTFRRLLPATALCLVTVAGCMTTEVQERHYPNGALQARTGVYTTTVGDVVAHGQYTEWFASGEKAKQGRFVQGQPHGKWTAWYQDGRRKSVEHYRDGRRCGDSTFWHRNGQESKRISYVDGKKHGPEIEWFRGGEKKWEAHYEHGAIKRFDSWNAAGQRVQSFSAERGYSNSVERDHIK